MSKHKSRLLIVCRFALIFGLVVLPESIPAASSEELAAPIMKFWWLWPAGFFIFSIALGILSVLGGVGGGLLYLALVTAFCPIHIDYVRIIALLLALASALVASPGLLRRDLAHLHLALPAALVSTAGAILGSCFGLTLSTPSLHLGLGAIIVLSGTYFIFQKNIRWPTIVTPDHLSVTLGMSGVYREENTKQNMTWAAHRTLPGLFLLFFAGLATGAFGLETAWANVAVFNLAMGVPLKIAVGSGKFLGSFTNASAAWIYFNHGCLISLLAIPSILGLITGSFAAIEIHSLVINRIRIFRFIAIFLLIICGIRIFIKGMLL